MPRKTFTIRSLTKVYGEGRSAVHALRGVDLDNKQGEIVVLLGPSGSGKSTLLNIVGGLDRATGGTVHFQDQNLTDMTDAQLTRYRRDHIGFVFQFYNLMPSLTARENVELVTEIARHPMQPDAALAMVGLKQRVAIARAVAKQPEVLFCDEPTGALDSKTGRILRIMQQSETTLPAGAPIMEIGNISNDLEVVVELLSTDAVQVRAGDRVIIDDWGGPATLAGVVERVDPFGIAKFSALGIAEQRVSAIIRLAGPPEDHSGLGHGFRVKARIVVWEDADTLTLPASALFRSGKDWAVFRVEDSKARLRTVTIGRNNGIEAQVLDGLDPGDRVVLFPSSGLTDGVRVAQRQVQ